LGTIAIVAVAESRDITDLRIALEGECHAATHAQFRLGGGTVQLWKAHEHRMENEA
jgi:hypothetical protein